MRLSSLPIQDGFYLPSDLITGECTYIIWPARTDFWREDFAVAVAKTFHKMVTEIARFEPVVLCANSVQYAEVLKKDLENVQVVEMASGKPWVRDNGAMILVNRRGRMRAVDARFGDYERLMAVAGEMVFGRHDDPAEHSRKIDDLIASKIANMEGLNRYEAPNYLLSGGVVVADGEGTIIVTEESLLADDNRAEMEELLKGYTGAKKILWLPYGLYGDTKRGSRVEDVCQFVAPGKVVLSWEDDVDDPEHERALANYDYLIAQTDAKGRKIEIHKLAEPHARVVSDEDLNKVHPRREDKRLALSYTNFYCCNGAVIVPVYDDDNDEVAIKMLGKLLAGREVVAINARDIALAGGSVRSMALKVPDL